MHQVNQTYFSAMDAAEDSAAADEQLFALQEEQEQRTENYDTSTSASDVDVTSLPAPLYTQNQRVYAKDETTGLLYPAMIRKMCWGAKSDSPLPVPALLELENNNKSNDAESTANENIIEEEEDDEDEDERRNNPKLNCHHYYVHYLGWNVKWDRWVDECYLYDHSDSTKLLAEKIQKHYDKVKPKKKGQKMSVSQVSRWMKKMVEIELEHMRLERDGNLVLPGSGDASSDTGKVDDAMKTDSDEAAAKSNEINSNDESKPAESAAANEGEKAKEVTKPIVKEETLQKQAQLRERGLQLKRKRIHADRLHIPFTLKKILVEEWEVISQCGMLYDLPSKVSVRDVLNKYLESKLIPMREKEEADNNSASPDGKDEDVKMEVDGENTTQQPSLVDREKEWVNMVEGIALVFDQALPIHLLFEQERAQYGSLRRRILAQRRIAEYNDQLQAMKVDGVNESESNTGTNNEDSQPATESSIDNKSATNTSSEESKPLPDRMSEVYGCEHLLRLFIRLPAVVAATPSISEADSRRIFSKLGDLIRYIQKQQSELFKSTFRKPLQNEVRKVAKEKVVAEEKVVAGG